MLYCLVYTVFYYAVQYCVYCTLVRCTALCVLYITMLYCILCTLHSVFCVLYFTMLYCLVCTVLYSVVLYYVYFTFCILCTVLYYAVLSCVYCTLLYCTVFCVLYILTLYWYLSKRLRSWFCQVPALPVPWRRSSAEKAINILLVLHVRLQKYVVNIVRNKLYLQIVCSR